MIPSLDPLSFSGYYKALPDRKVIKDLLFDAFSKNVLFHVQNLICDFLPNRNQAVIGLTYFH